MTIELKPRRIFLYLLGFILFLLIANIVINAIDLTYYQNDGALSSNKYIKVLIQLFDFDTEAHNIPTYYSAMALSFSAILLWIISRNYKNVSNQYYYWLGLAIIFAYLSLDEILALHEHLVRLTQSILGISGDGLGYWIIPYAIGILILGIIYFKFFMKIQKNILKYFLISGVVFISGAVGFELISLDHAAEHGMSSPGYVVYYTIEEFLEMLGVIIFIYALLGYKSFSLRIE